LRKKIKYFCNYLPKNPIIVGRKSLKEERQKEIVIAFYKVAKREGLENASIAKVAECLKINPSLVIHYFKTREELLNALVNFILKRYLEIYKIDGQIDSKEKLIELIDNLFSRKWHRLFDDGVFYSCYALIYRNEKFKEKYKDLHDALRGMLRNSLIEAKQNRIIDVQNVEQTAEILYTLVDGAYYYLSMVYQKKELEKKTLFLKKYALSLLNLVK
jgi:AcrR family transcriptional regulator